MAPPTNVNDGGQREQDTSTRKLLCPRPTEVSAQGA